MWHYEFEIALGASLVIVRFFFPVPPAFVFFLARVTLIGGGVPVREGSSSTSYGGNGDNDGVGVDVDVAAPFLIDGDDSLTICAFETGEGLGTPSGISPTLSMTNTCLLLPMFVLLSVGRCESTAAYVEKRNNQR